VHLFGVVGLANGLAVMADEETRTLWDHITGEAIEGPLEGHRLEWWPIRVTTVTAALEEWPDLLVLVSDYRSLPQRFMGRVQNKKINAKGWLPPRFRSTMSREVDPRLDEMTQGLGVIVDDQGRFYPMERIPDGGLVDDWNGRAMRIDRRAADGVPQAEWEDGDNKPMQLLSRWYGFSFTYPECRIVPIED
jgi:hypothetical protein